MSNMMVADDFPNSVIIYTFAPNISVLLFLSLFIRDIFFVNEIGFTLFYIENELLHPGCLMDPSKVFECRILFVTLLIEIGGSFL